MLIKNFKSVKRAIKIVVGFTILLVGIALLVLPGPGMLIIVFGLIILSAEYIWAQKLLEKGKLGLNKLKIRK